MSTPEVFIDLDDRGDWRDEAKPVAPQRNRSYRAVALGAVTVLLLGLPTMSMRPKPPIVQVGIFPRPSEDSVLIGDATVSTHGGTITVSNMDGTVRWTYRVEGTFDFVSVDADTVSGVFLARAMRQQETGGDGQYRLATSEAIGLDTATGQVRWRVDGGLVRRGDRLVGTEDHWIRVYHGDPPAIRWEASGFVRTALERSEVGKRAWGLKADGTLSEMDLETGAVRDRAKLPPSMVSKATAKGGYLFVLGGLLVIQADTVEVYDLITQQPVSWESPWLPDYECGTLVCGRYATGPNGRAGAADPRTGRVVWTLSTGQWFWPTSVGIVLVSSSSGTGLATVLGLIDPQTGAIRVPVDNWHILTFQGDQIIVARPQEGRTHLGVMTPTGVRALGSVGSLLVACQNSRNLMMCVLPDGRAGLWELSP